MKRQKIRRTRTGFGTKGNAKHAANITAREAKRKERRGLRAGFKDYLLKQMEKKKKRPGDKPALVPNRKEIRAHLVKERRARRKRAQAR